MWHAKTFTCERSKSNDTGTNHAEISLQNEVCDFLTTQRLSPDQVRITQWGYEHKGTIVTKVVIFWKER
jgi:hypothetical protein